MTRTALVHSPTKERLLDAAQELMLAKGFAATTVEEICEQAKLTKGSFFHYFESKEELGKVLLERFCNTGDQLHRSLGGTERDPLKRVYHYLDGVIKLSKDSEMRKGCLLGTFAQELCDSHPAIRQQCAKGFGAWAARFGEELAHAKARHAPKASFNPKELAEHLIAIMEGSLILGKAQNNMQAMERNLRHYKRYLQSLFGR